MPAIVASDLEGTLSAGQTWRGMRSYLEYHGEAAAFVAMRRRHLPQLLLFRLGLIRAPAFKERWILAMLALFHGYTNDRLADVATWVVEKELWPNRRQPVIDELGGHRQAGRQVVVVSGIFQPFLDVFTNQLDADGIGTPLRWENGTFSGQINGPFNIGARKLAALQSLGPIHTAYGDTVNDIPMLAASTHAVAVHPDKLLGCAARERGWRILG